MAKLSLKAERAAWTAHITGEKPKANKYGNERTGDFVSKLEADTATKLYALESCGQITDLQMQVPITLVEGKDGVARIVYVADFVYKDKDGAQHVVDAKGVKTAVYRLKKRMAALLKGIVIEEVQARHAPVLHRVRRGNRR